jgi:lipopolysaccharide transport system ATP-binding protein
MGDVAKDGRTVLFVSHNMSAVRKLCHRAILLDSGKIVGQGETATVLEQYLGGDREAQSTFSLPTPTDSSLEAWIRTINVLDGKGEPAVAIPVGQPWQIVVNFTVRRAVEHFTIAAALLTTDGNAVRLSWSTPSKLSPGEYKVVFREDVVMLGSARYQIAIGLSEQERSIQYAEDAGILEIASYAEGVDLVRVGHAGVIMNPFQIEITKQSDSISLTPLAR